MKMERSSILAASVSFATSAKATVALSEKEFNNEHVLPNWLLRRYGLHERVITLPNDTTFRYDRYTIPCCADCNGLMGREVEQPIRALIEQGSQAVYEHVQRGGALRIFVWLALIILADSS